MTTITPDEMKSLETLFMSETGTPRILLMEHAAQGVAAAISPPRTEIRPCALPLRSRQ
ncbi:MAG: hypothetical protein ACLTXW_06175 [Christensenellales bacterium]